MTDFETEEIETEYGVDGMVKERKNEYSAKFTTGIAVGVVLCILSCVPLMICKGMNASFDQLLQEGDYTVSKKEEAPVIKKKALYIAKVIYSAVIFVI